MPPESYKMGPGTLTLGVGATSFAQQMRSFTVIPGEQVDSEDDIEVLSGDTVEGEDTVTLEFSVKGKVLQDLTTAGFVSYTWTNASDEVPFVFRPRNDVARQVAGTVRIVPVSIGGDVKARMESDFDWKCVGADPVFGDYVAP